ncbi:MAG: TIGR03617 family F420-dependent LLM class oxidoreductase [Caulobacteraceae bacterium]|nr:TIGR03617 family F420-dependent LLM class oxidoreductase [Caulobacteraceae bacterium]
MRYSLRLQPSDTATIETLTAAVRRADDLGFGAVWSSEAGHDPFVTLPLVAAASPRLKIGTGIAVAFARSPFATAQVAWDLQRLSRGRLRLGLGPQVKPHIERRYGMRWPGGLGALREYVACCRAVWSSFESGERPAFRGEHYQYTLLNPEFNPGPLPEAEAHVPIWLAAVGPVAARMAGEIGDGLHIHAFHTESYLREVLVPAYEAGREAQGRASGGIESACPVFSGIVHDEQQERLLRDAMRKYIAFYASTPAYAPVLAHAGCPEIHAPLRVMSREGRWDDMPALVSDEIVDQFAVFDAPRELGRRLKAKYEGILSEIAIYKEGTQFAAEADWPELLEGLGCAPA